MDFSEFKTLSSTYLLPSGQYVMFSTTEHITYEYRTSPCSYSLTVYAFHWFHSCARPRQTVARGLSMQSFTMHPRERIRTHSAYRHWSWGHSSRPIMGDYRECSSGSVFDFKPLLGRAYSYKASSVQCDQFQRVYQSQ